MQLLRRHQAARCAARAHDAEERVAGAAYTENCAQDLVSQSDGSGDDDDDDDDDDEAPQEPAPDDGEGSDFEELQARACSQLLPPAPPPRSRPNPGGRWTLSSSISSPWTSTECARCFSATWTASPRSRYLSWWRRSSHRHGASWCCAKLLNADAAARLFVSRATPLAQW